ncbi:MAG: 3-deoxy-7-phosphoheptulonate synthase [Desulfohalobiaceae bacterium]|nr:3-deoxy-7-phosphoheptulonate synthase [Desulfohalobiaceae bacterium]
MPSTDDVRIKEYKEMITPRQLKSKLPVSLQASRTVEQGRKTIEQILSHTDNRVLVITGPCSIHDEQAALDYARRLARLQDEVGETLFLVMRAYFEKPRTTVGWKGLINDPHLDNSYDMETGLFRARKLLLRINELGLPVATEMLEPVIPQYIADLVSWAAIGARTTESQTHRQMASGLSMPVGFKNTTEGNLSTAVNAMLAARSSQCFLGIDQEGRTSIVNTRGNPNGHIVLRGGQRPNYDPISIEEARLKLIEKGLPEGVIVDCSHANSRKKHQGQANVFRNVIEQILSGNQAVFGLMLESYIHEGNQKYQGDTSALRYGVSITDECMSWETTAELLRSTHKKILSSTLLAA